MSTTFTVLGILVFVGSCVGQTARIITACNGDAQCSMLNPTCETGQVFPLKALYGYKPVSLNCSTDGFTISCTDVARCCTAAGGVCFKPVTSTQFDSLHNSCFGVKSCSVPGHRFDGGCTNGTRHTFSSLSSYSLVEYTCLNASAITNFSSSDAVEGTAVAVVYRREPSRNSSTTWFCRVNSTSGNVLTDVMLSKGRNRNSESRGCSSIGFDLDTLLLCSTASGSYNFIQRTTPFDVVLQLGDNSIDSAYVVARAVSDSQLRVTCGGTPPTSGDATSTPAAAVTSVAPGSTSSPPGMETSSPQTPGGASSTPGQGTGHPDSSGTSSQGTGPPDSSSTHGQGVHIIGVAVAGWVMAMLLLIVLTVLSVLLYRHGLCHKKKSTYGGSSSSRDPPADNTYLEVIPDPTVVSPRTTPSHVYVNEASDQTSSTSVEPGRESQNEYSPLERPRDQSNIYTSLRNA